MPPPRSSNPLFLGRTAELAKIEHQLFPIGHSKYAVLSEPNVLVIQGLGGNGKSELCLRYLKMHESRYATVLSNNTIAIGSCLMMLQLLGYLLD